MEDRDKLEDIERFMQSEEGEEALAETSNALEGRTIRSVTFSNSVWCIATELHLDNGECFVIYQPSLQVEAIREALSVMPDEERQKDHLEQCNEEKPATATDTAEQRALGLLGRFVEDWRKIVEDPDRPTLPAADCADYILRFWTEAQALWAKQAPNECAKCAGKGWLLKCTAKENALALQHCDACVRFDSDDVAQFSVASDEAVCRDVLHAFCRKLEVEAARAANERHLPALEQRLNTICETNVNAMYLCRRCIFLQGKHARAVTSGSTQEEAEP